MDKQFKVGMVGCGRVAQVNHIPSLLGTKDVKIVAVCDKSEQLAQSTAQTFNIGAHYTDFAQMLSEEELNIVDVCTSPETLASLSILAMEAGCHVLVEKPMALSTKQADKMISVAESNQVKLGVVHNVLFSPAVVKAKAIIERGDIGDITGVDIRFGTHKGGKYTVLTTDKDHWAHRLPGGIFMEMLPHSIYLMREFLGSLELLGVYAEKLGNYEWMPNDELRVILKGRSGLGVITSSCNWLQGMVMIDIFGTKMALHVDIGDSIIVKYGGLGPERVAKPLSRGWDNLSQSLQRITGTILSGGKFILKKHYRYIDHYILIRRFVESIQNNLEPPVTPQAGRLNLFEGRLKR